MIILMQIDVYIFRTQKHPSLQMGVFQWNFIFVGLKRYLEYNCDII